VPIVIDSTIDAPAAPGPYQMVREASNAPAAPSLVQAVFSLLADVISQVTARWVTGTRYVDGSWAVSPAGAPVRFWVATAQGVRASEEAVSATGTARVRMLNTYGTGEYVAQAGADA